MIHGDDLLIEKYSKYGRKEKKKHVRPTLTPRTRIARFIVGHMMVIWSLHTRTWWGMLGALLILGAVINYCPVESYIRSKIRGSSK